MIPDNDAGRAASRKVLVPVLILLPTGESDNLSRHIGAQLLLAGAALDHHIRADLAVPKPDELQRHNGCALMEQLIEGMLPVSSRLAKDHRAGLVIHRLAETVHRLAVGFHVQLLQVGRETA